MQTTTVSAQAAWDPILAGIRSDALDCLQSSMAAIADEAYGTGTHLALGCQWRFPVPDENGVPCVQPSVAERMAQGRDVLGLDVGEPEGPLDPPELRRLADSGRIYVVTEAYDLAWLPYSRATTRYREMPHSFLLERAEDGYTVIDAYYADTEWGQARPTTIAMTADEFDHAMQGPGTAVRVAATGPAPDVDPDVVMRDNALTARAAGPDIEAYIELARRTLVDEESIDRLVLDVWHLCRERLLYTVWLGEHEAAPAVAAVADAWQQLAGQSYLASRRVRRGAPPNPVILDDMARLLRSDAALMTQLGGAPAVVDAGAVEQAVRESLATSLKLDPGAIEAATALRSLPGFDSFELVAMIEQVEERLGVEFPAEVSAADLVDVRGVCRMFTQALEERRS